MRSEVEARPLHSLRQLPANASEGIPDAVRRPEAMTAASATGTDLITSLTTSLVSCGAGEVAERPSATFPCTWASQRPRGVDYAKQGRTRLIGSGPDSSEPANFPPPSYVRLSVGERYGAGDRGSAARLPGPLIFWVSGPAGVCAPLPSTPAPIPEACRSGHPSDWPRECTLTRTLGTDRLGSLTRQTSLAIDPSYAK